jgi:cell wall-associated NlpC family hydrolase
MQVIFGLVGIKLRRDSWMQHHDAQFVSEESAAAQPGDVYFFAEQGNKITHVGLALGQNRILHARGYVRINSLTDGETDFDPNLANTFVDTRTFL